MLAVATIPGAFALAVKVPAPGANSAIPKIGPSSGATSIGDRVEEASASADPLLGAMKAELAREQSLLVLPGLQRPYFMEYRLEDIASWDAVANYGALSSDVSGHQRVVRVELRIGDYTSDSSSARGDGYVQLAPTDNDVAAIKFALWNATDIAYKNALSAYATKQATLKRFQNAPNAPDFTPGKPVTLLEPLAAIDIDRDAWRTNIIQASGLFRTDPKVAAFADTVQYSSASVQAVAVNRYMVDSEGAMLRHGYTGYTDSISVGGQAADGMELGRNNGSTAMTSAGLESAASLHSRTIKNLLSYQELRNAPLVDADDYHGPVLFSGDAAADVISKLFVPNIEADRPDMGTAARTQGVYQSSLHSPVLPVFLTVLDDPTLRTFEGKDLLGAYRVDDEGTPAAPLTLVDHGKLVAYDVDREPIKDFPLSNGHGRAVFGQAAHSRAGVIEVKATPSLTSAELRNKLLSMAKEQGRDAYEVETLGGGELQPRLLYRISADGKRTLVRGAIFDELDQRAMRSEIVAAGGTPYIAQTFSPLPQTTIVPELLFADIAVKRANPEQVKLPYYEPPKAGSRE